MKKFALFDFFIKQSVKIGEVAWIDNLTNIVPANAEEEEIDALLKSLETVTVNWPKGKKQSDKYLAKIIHLSDSRQDLSEKMKRLLKGDELIGDIDLGRGKRTKIGKTYSSEESGGEQEQVVSKVKAKRKDKCVSSAILQQVKERLPQKQDIEYRDDDDDDDDEEPLQKMSKHELIDSVNTLNLRLAEITKENHRLRQAISMLEVMPRAVEKFTALVDNAELVLKRQFGSRNGPQISKETPPLDQPVHENRMDNEEFFVQDVVSQDVALQDVALQDQQVKPLHAWQIERCSKAKPQKFVNDLMQAMYSTDYMATHSVTGSKSSTNNKEAKPAIDPKEVQEIIAMTKKFFPEVDDTLVKQMMGQKLNNCTKRV